LLAAAVAGVQTDDDNSSSDDGVDQELLTLDKAMELWNNHKTPDGEKSHSFCNTILVPYSHPQEYLIWGGWGR